MGRIEGLGVVCSELTGLSGRLTGLLLLEGQVGPVLLHAVAEGHPQLSLFLQRHALPPLLNVGQGGVRDGVVRRCGGGSSGAGDEGGGGGGLTAGMGEAGAQRS